MSASVFVMSDVVGSTALWEAHGDAMRAALETHDGLVHGAVESAGGRVFKHTGDGMIAVFDDADAAVVAALGAVGALAGGEWGDTGPLEIRVSVHAGAASERGGDFFGPPVNKVARINGIGHPGQVLVSDVARQLMSEPAGVDLGMHQLKDLSDPVRLWQLDHLDHPSLRTLKKARHNLPVMATEFIGRQAEVDELRSLLDQHRLVTITGVGGCGKTRLAVEAGAALADRFPGGVWFADMTTERVGDKVASRAIAALGLIQSVAPDAGGPVDVLNEATAGYRTLLIIDNCEHLIDDVADFAAEVLAEAPDVTVLATSRESLSVDGEWVWRIPNLHDAAVELFVSRASAAGVVGLETHLDQIEEICGQLDDIPLAIELAAARLSSLSVEELASRLDDRFSLLGGGRGRRRQRQQTLQTMMDWSYGLLDDDEQHTLNQLAVFSGTFPLSGAEAVAANTNTPVIDVLDSLVERSLVVPSIDTGRYRLLETVRLYALDRLLNTDQLADTRDRHLAWMIQLSGRERFAAAMDGEMWELEEQRLAEVDNAVAAMEWADESGQHDALFSLYVGGQTYWSVTGGVALSWLGRVPEPTASEPGLRCEWLTTSAHILIDTGDTARGFEQAFAAATIVDELVAAGLNVDLAMLSLLYRGMFLTYSGDSSGALEDSARLSDLQIEGRNRSAAWLSLMLRTNVLMIEGDPAALETALEFMAESRSLSQVAVDTAPTYAAMLLSTSERMDEALSAALQGLDSEIIGQSNRMTNLVPAARSFAALGRIEDALDTVEKDFGPMIDAQKSRLRASQVLALTLIFDRLQHHEPIDHLAAVAEALAQDHFASDHEVRMHLAKVVGGDEEFAALRAPDPDELTPDCVSALINNTISDIRNIIANRAP